MAGEGNLKPPKPVRSESLNEVLKAAYSIHLRDKITRLAVRKCLG